MPRWPVVTPEKDRTLLRTCLEGADLQPLVFDGPLNVLIGLQACAQGAVELSKTKQAYDEIPAPRLD